MANAAGAVAIKRLGVVLSPTLSPLITKCFLESFSACENVNSIDVASPLKHFPSNTFTKPISSKLSDDIIPHCTHVVILSDPWTADHSKAQYELDLVKQVSQNAHRVVKFSGLQDKKYSEIGRDAEAFATAALEFPNVTIASTGMYMQRLLENPLLRLIQGGVLSLPVPNTSVPSLAPVSISDLAVAVSNFLSNSSRDSPNSLVLRHPTAYSLDGLADSITKTLGLVPPTRVSVLPTWAVQPSMWIQGSSPDEIRSYLDVWAKYVNYGGDVNESSNDLPALKTELQSLPNFLRENATELQRKN